MAPELIGCLLVKRQAGEELLWGLIVELRRIARAARLSWESPHWLAISGF
jgi:hypothetical protein